MPEWVLAPPRGSDDRLWLDLRVALWPDASQAEHLASMADAVARGHYVRLVLSSAGAAMGFAEASKRSDYVNGTASSPVAFLEGLYVEPAARRRGVARALVESVVAWALEEGLSELASDSLTDNLAAHAAHRALGFEETERVVYFRRPLGRRPTGVSSPCSVDTGGPPMVTHGPASTEATPPRLREIVADAARYWEPRRLGYNALLGAIFLGWVVFTWPHFRGAFTPSAIGALTVLALLANVCYCAAYLVDIPLQYSPLRAAWRGRRRVLWLAGAILAAALTWYWVADEIYPGVA